MSSAAEADCDVLISGGGMVGGCLAVALARCGHHVAVVEAQARLRGQAQSVDSPGNYDDRASALSWGSRLLLEQLGLWPEIAAAAAPIEHIHVSQRGHFGATRLHAEEEGTAALGYVLENRVLGAALAPRLTTDPAIELLAPARIIGFEPVDGGVVARVSLAGQDSGQVGGEQCSIRARLLIAAEGTRSPLRELGGFELRETPYGQSAVIANMDVERDLAGWAFERFTDSGPLALLPLHAAGDGGAGLGGDGRRCSLVWTLRDADVDGVLALDDDEFLRRLQARFGWRLGRLLHVGRRSAFPLGLVEALPQYRGRLLLLGNAARTLHPAAGQGFNLALRDLCALAELLGEARANDAGSDPGDAALLAEFAARRHADQRAVVRMTDGLVKLFSSRCRPLGQLRGAGLLACDLLPTLRHALARQSMGLHTRLSLPG